MGNRFGKKSRKQEAEQFAKEQQELKKDRKHKVNLILIGDEDTKTKMMLSRQISNLCGNPDRPRPLIVDGNSTEVTFTETTGQVGYPAIRTMTYDSQDVFLVFYDDSVTKSSLKRTKMWFEEIKQTCFVAKSNALYNPPILLVAVDTGEKSTGETKNNEVDLKAKAELNELSGGNNIEAIKDRMRSDTTLDETTKTAMLKDLEQQLEDTGGRNAYYQEASVVNTSVYRKLEAKIQRLIAEKTQAAAAEVGNEEYTRINVELQKAKAEFKALNELQVSGSDNTEPGEAINRYWLNTTEIAETFGTGQNGSFLRCHATQQRTHTALMIRRTQSKKSVAGITFQSVPTFLRLHILSYLPVCKTSEHWQQRKNFRQWEWISKCEAELKCFVIQEAYQRKVFTLKLDDYDTQRRNSVVYVKDVGRYDLELEDLIVEAARGARPGILLRPPRTVVDDNQMFDIGIFDSHVNSIGTQFLTHTNKKAQLIPSTLDLKQITKSLDADPKSTMTSFANKYTFLNAKQCHTLIQDTEHAWNQNGKQLKDFKYHLTKLQLVELIGIDAVSQISKQINHLFNRIVIRRCSEKGKCIRFHCDHSLQTMQIPLNDENEYIGGKLCFVMNEKLFYPKRLAGSATIHRNNIAHAVTTLRAGVRYGLFLLNEPK